MIPDGPVQPSRPGSTKPRFEEPAKIIPFSQMLIEWKNGKLIAEPSPDRQLNEDRRRLIEIQRRIAELERENAISSDNNAR